MSQKEKEVKQSAAEVENENLETEHTEADNGETSAGTENQEAETKENEAKEAKDAKKDPKDAQIEELQDRLKRQMAEFDNFRKRTEKEKAAMYEIGAKDIIERILPVIDNFERGFKSVTEEELQTPFAKGMDMVYKQTMKMLEDLQVKPIEALGSEFNPDFHNAVMHVDDDSQGENIIVEEFEKGYTYRDVVIRHSMVKVAN